MKLKNEIASFFLPLADNMWSSQVPLNVMLPHYCQKEAVLSVIMKQASNNVNPKVLIGLGDFLLLKNQKQGTSMAVLRLTLRSGHSTDGKSDPMLPYVLAN